MGRPPHNSGTEGAATMKRLLIVIFLLIALLPAVMPTHTIAASPELLQDFNRDACYSTCPCAFSRAFQACADCMQECDRKFWRNFDEKSRKLEKED
jgi:hypothetical protein